MVKHVLRIEHLLEKSPSPRRVLDYGCGDGAFLEFANLFGFEAYGIDFSATRAERARERGVIRVKDLRAFDALGVGKVDAAVLFQVLEHMDEPMELLLQLAERVKPGGVLIVEVPDCRGLAVPRDFAEFRALHPLEHINAFTPGTLRHAVLKAGFHCIARPPAHVTTRWVDLARTEASRVLHRPTTNQYFLRRVPEGKA